MGRATRHRFLSLHIAVCVMGLLGLMGGVATGDPPSTIGDRAVLAFLERHWQVPVPPQGKPPARYSPLEASLDPESCAVCHRLQYDDWKRSLHSKSMGPGVMGQTKELIRDDPGTALLCYACHAPLTEQQEKIQAKSSSRSRFKKNATFLTSLQPKGLTCAGCHVRGHQPFGPPKRDGTLENSRSSSQLPHGGAIRTPAFERAEFCKGCHQFEVDGYALNGKLLENTYNEWQDGPFGREGKACQSCHMPDRRHLWRGIHDPEMVKQGVTVRLAVEKGRYRVGEEVEATITLTNSGVGHYFPTYVTPKILIGVELIDEAGLPVPGSFQQERIGREATLDLTEELFDTRIPPGKTHTFRYVRLIDRPGLKLKASVVVAPDDFYVKFFEAIIPRARTQQAGAWLKQALGEARESSFFLFKEEVDLS
ncbi:MAG: hypothetical protein HY278_04490 [candidate division NC10 bacterium]|nr:hypothetical protein [candidate division NC10 bacterium]